MIIHVVWFALIGMCGLEAMRVFDCSAPDLNYTTISLVDLPTCTYGDTSADRRDFYGHIVQRTELVKVPIVRCRVKLTRHAMNCNKFTPSSGNWKSLVTYTRPMSLQICNDMVLYSRYVYWNDRITSEIKPGRVTYETHTLVGTTGSSGECWGETFSDSHGHWDNALINGNYEYYADVGNGIYDRSKGTVQLSSGMTCQYVKGECEDIDGYSYFWAVKAKEMCDTTQFVKIYSGTIGEVSIASKSRLNVTYFVVNTTSNMITLQKKDDDVLCSLEYYSTSADGVIVIESNPRQHPQFAEGSDSLDVSVNLQYLTKLSGVDLHLKQTLSSLYNMINYNECLLERSVAMLNQHVGFVDPIEYAYIHNDGPGATAVTAGEVIHVAQCVAKFATVRDSNGCYKEIPVNVSGEAMFASPRTRILQRTGSPVPCSELFGTQIKESGVWYAVYPNIRRAPVPKVVKLGGPNNWEYTSMADIINGGLYTQDQLSSAHKALLYPYEYSAITSTWSSQVLASGYTGGSISVEHMISEEAVSTWIYGRLVGFYEFFGKVGHFMSVIMGIYFCWSLISNVISAALNGWHLHQVFGLSWRLFASCFKGIAGAMIAMEHRDKMETMRNRMEAYIREQEMGSLADQASEVPLHNSRERLYMTRSQMDKTILDGRGAI